MESPEKSSPSLHNSSPDNKDSQLKSVQEQPSHSASHSAIQHPPPNQQSQLASQMQSPHFFSMTGIPKFGKNWMDNFIPDEEMQNIFLTSEVVRNVLMLQCVYFASLYHDLFKYKQSYLNVTQAVVAPPGLASANKDKEVSQLGVGETERSMQQMSIVGGGDQPFKVGIIGCG